MYKSSKDMEEANSMWEFNAPTNILDLEKVNHQENMGGMDCYFIDEESEMLEDESEQPFFNTATPNHKASTFIKKTKTENVGNVEQACEKNLTPAKCLKLESGESKINTMKESVEEESLEEYRKKEESLKVEYCQHSSNALRKATKPSFLELQLSTKVAKNSLPNNERTKSHVMTTRQDKCTKMSFEKSLRQVSKEVPCKPKPTIPKPFSFDKGSRKRCYSEEKPLETYVSTAKAVMDFQKKTPLRFRQGSRLGKVSLAPAKTMKLTQPKTPNITKTKRRLEHIESQEQKEEKEWEEIQKYQFQAKPVNKAILENPEKLKPVGKKRATVPVGFNFTNNHLRASISFVPDNKKDRQGFKAQPVPAGIFDGVKGLRERKKIPLTKPQSPNFASKKFAKNSGTERESLPKRDAPQRVSAATAGVSCSSRMDMKTITKPKPFKFEEEDRKRFAAKREKIQEVITEEKKMASAFKARPLPDFASAKLPERSKSVVTKPEPFHMKTDERVSARVIQHQQDLLNHYRDEEEQRKFRANTSYRATLHGEPWKPQLNHKFTEPVGFKLKSEERAIKRNEYEEWRLAQEAEQRQAEEEARVELEAENERERRAIRKQMEVKANPIRRYKRFEIVKSSKNLTVPLSPGFSQHKNK